MLHPKQNKQVKQKKQVEKFKEQPQKRKTKQINYRQGSRESKLLQLRH